MSRPAAPARKATKSEYIETDTLNKVSRRTCITGTANIIVAGRSVLQPDVHIRGDLSRLTHPTAQTPTLSKPSTSVPSINIGKCVVVSVGAVIRPPSKLSRGIMQFYHVKIGDNVFIGKDCVVSAVEIRGHVWVGEGSVLGAFSVVRENVKVLPGTVVPSFMQVPPNVVIGGQPARIVGEVGEGWGASVGLGGGGSAEGWVEGGELREVVKAVK